MKYLRQILQQFPRRTYVGYTATPFANVLIDSDENHLEFGPSLYQETSFTVYLDQEGISARKIIFQNMVMRLD